ncbi:MAG TPA: response regulator transcription factor [Burkholderiales bacterium]|nr:response regulator transcription factor [Burkholderiales bacterium]
MKILIADDHPIVRHGVKQVLAEDPDMEIVAEARDGDEALRLARERDWDVAILDFSMPGRSGFDLLADLRREFPARPVIILSIHAEQMHAARVLRAGGAGYLNKSSAPQELARAVRKVAAGGRYVSAALAELLANDVAGDPSRALHEQLSDREYRVMWLLASGRQINEIARDMQLRPSTVSTYRTRVFQKLHLRNNAELVQYAVRNQLVE